MLYQFTRNRRKLQKSQTEETTTSESMRFNRMEPETSENLRHFYSRLVQQADKCGFHCGNCDSSFQQRMIRDRLILIVDKCLCTDILTLSDDPSIEEILSKYEEDQKFKTVCRVVLPYLPLHDLDLFAKSHPKLQLIVHSYLENGQQILINSDTLEKYPVTTNGDLYEAYGTRAINVVINGAIRCEVPNLLRLFPRILELTIMNMTIYGDEMNLYPTGIRKLTLMNNVVDEATESKEWLYRLESLESLFLHSNETLFLKPSRLLSLTLIQQDFCGEIFGSGYLDIPTLKSLTLSGSYIGPKDLKEMKSLQHLCIRGLVDSKIRAVINDLQLQCVDVYTQEIPKEENLILRLNDDCLLHVMKFLNGKDLLALHDTHIRFQITRITGYTIDLLSLPLTENLEFYKRIAPFVSSLNIKDISNEELPQLMPLFTNVSEMTFSCSIPADVDLEAVIPTGLRELNFHDMIESRINNLSKVFRRLSLTLSKLDLCSVREEDISEALIELRNIREFHYWGTAEVTIPLLKFLRLNMSSMQIIDLNIDSEAELEKELWLVITQMSSLKILRINCCECSADEPLSHLKKGTLPMLEHLEIVCFNAIWPRDILKSLDGSKLKTVALCVCPFDIQGVFDGRMKNLWKLGITIYGSNWQPDNKSLFSLPSLRVLGLEKQEVSNILPLIKGLPNLTDFFTEDDIFIGNDALVEIHTYLRQTNRILKLDRFWEGLNSF